MTRNRPAPVRGRCTCVVGLQWGDEAKGKIVDLLTDQHDYVVRYNGGANAGHTVVADGRTYKLSLLPTGVLRPRLQSVIANGVVVIDGARSGMEQIAAYLDGRDGIASIHLVSHGDAGLLHLGSDALTADSLAAHAASLARIGAALAEDGDILIYGCDVGASADGARFVDTLARLTDADVAASDDDTGFAEAGGDWTLEARSGIVETDALSIDTYRGILSQQNSGAWTIGTNTASFTGGGAVVTVDFQAEGAEASFSAIRRSTTSPPSRRRCRTPPRSASPSTGTRRPTLPLFRRPAAQASSPSPSRRR